MRRIVFVLLSIFAMNVAAQEETVAVDTVRCDSMSLDIPQVAFEELDSMIVESFDDRYVVVYKEGKCGVYDLLKNENVTRIEYDALELGFSREIEGERFTYFTFIYEGQKGILGISEATNHFITILFPDEDDNE